MLDYSVSRDWSPQQICPPIWRLPKRLVCLVPLSMCLLAGKGHQSWLVSRQVPMHLSLAKTAHDSSATSSSSFSASRLVKICPYFYSCRSVKEIQANLRLLSNSAWSVSSRSCIDLARNLGLVWCHNSLSCWTDLLLGPESPYSWVFTGYCSDRVHLKHFAHWYW